MEGADLQPASQQTRVHHRSFVVQELAAFDLYSGHDMCGPRIWLTFYDTTIIRLCTDGL
jgi:hypothetical protein